MTKALRKNTRRSITGSFGRYIAILLIILLGVGFFSGLRLTKGAMLAVETDYLRTYRLYDLRLVSTIGFDDDDVAAAKAVEGTEDAAGSVSADFITVYGNEENVLRAHMITQGVNLPVLVEGRMPEKGNEILVESDKFPSEVIGQTIELGEYNTEDTMENFRYSEYVVVGRARSPMYISVAAGTSSLGSGSLTGFVLMPEDGFDFEYYTELYVKTTDEFDLYSDEYDSYMDDFSDRMESAVLLSVQNRYDDLIADAEDEIADAEETLATETADAEKELADAKTELDDAKSELEDAAIQLDDARKELDKGERSLADGEDELRSAKAELDDAAAQMDPDAGSWDAALSTARQQIADGQAQLDQGIADGRAQLETAKEQLDAGETQYAAGAEQLQAAWEQYQTGYDQWSAGNEQYQAGLAQYQAGKEAYDAGYQQYLDARAQFDAVKDLMPPEQAAEQEAILNATESQLSGTFAMLEQTKAQLDAAGTELDSSKAQLDEAKSMLDSQQAALDTSRMQLDQRWEEYNSGVEALEQTRAEKQAVLDQSSSQLDSFESGVEQYRDGVRQLASARAKLESGRAEYEDGKSEYEDGLKQYQDGLAEYEDGRKELDESVADAKVEIEDAKKELADLDEPELYVLKRSESNSGYITFNSDSDIVANVAKVFPIFFFLVAALICSTTMTRMVDDDRTQIGTLCALGYSKGSILTKYLLYSGSAAVIGTLIGYFAGGYLFPLVIWVAYQMLYRVDGYICVYQWPVLAVSMAAALLCSVGTTWLALRQQMRSTPAELIRPAAPAAGKRVLLERVTFIWSRLKFLHKVSLRNIFRFKKRMFMMLLGIAGCTALLVTGLGINDSVAGIGEDQFGNIQLYDIDVTSVDPIDDAFLDDLLAENGDDIESATKVLKTSVDLNANRTTKSAYLIASDDESITDKIHFFLGEEEVKYPQKGEVLVTEKLASQLGLKVGDSLPLSVSDTERGTVVISGIVKNYVYNYVYMTGETYTQTFGKAYEPQNLLVNVKEDLDPHIVSTRFSSRDDVAAVAVKLDNLEFVDNMMASLDYVIILVVACAAALAFIVMFNLGNINISERVREIATIKVLGFHRGETGAYVFRENLILSMMGIACGIPLGMLLHRFVMSQITVDMVSFNTVISGKSYLLAVILVLIFTLCTDLILRRKIYRIDMAESLKSVE